MERLWLWLWLCSWLNWSCLSRISSAAARIGISSGQFGTAPGQLSWPSIRAYFCSCVLLCSGVSLIPLLVSLGVTTWFTTVLLAGETPYEGNFSTLHVFLIAGILWIECLKLYMKLVPFPPVPVQFPGNCQEINTVYKTMFLGRCMRASVLWTHAQPCELVICYILKLDKTVFSVSVLRKAILSTSLEPSNCVT